MPIDTPVNTRQFMVFPSTASAPLWALFLLVGLCMSTPVVAGGGVEDEGASLDEIRALAYNHVDSILHQASACGRVLFQRQDKRRHGSCEGGMRRDGQFRDPWRVGYLRGGVRPRALSLRKSVVL